MNVAEQDGLTPCILNLTVLYHVIFAEKLLKYMPALECFRDLSFNNLSGVIPQGIGMNQVNLTYV